MVLISKSTKMKKQLLVFSLVFCPFLLLCQKVDSIRFSHHLSVIDSLESYQNTSDCIFYMDSISSATSLNEYQLSYFNIIKGKYFVLQRKDSLALAILKEERKFLFSKGDTTSISYSNLIDLEGKILENESNYDEALKRFLKSKSIKEKLLDEEHPDYINSINDIAIIYARKGQDEKAKPLFIRAMNLTKKGLGEKHPDYATCLNNLAIIHKNNGEYEIAEPLYIQAMDLRKEVLGEKHFEYAKSLHDLGILYYHLEQYEKTEKLFIESKDIRKETLGVDHPDYANSLNDLAELYKALGQYDNAEELLIETKNIEKKILGEEHPSYAVTLNNLAVLYFYKDEYDKVEPLFLQIKEIRKKVLGEKHPLYTSILNNLGVLYTNMGDYEKAERSLSKVIEIEKEVLGEEHPDYLMSLLNLASVNLRKGDNEKAEKQYIEVKEKRLKILGPKHSDYAACIYNLAYLYRKTGEYEKAEPLFIEAINIEKEVLGEEHPDYITSITNLARLYHKMGQHEKVEPLCFQAIKVYKEKYSIFTFEYVSTLNYLALHYQETDQFEKATNTIIEAKDISKQLLINAFAFMSEKEKFNYHQRTIKSLWIIKKIGLDFQNQKLAGEIYNTLLFEKGLHLSSNLQTRAYYEDQIDPAINQTYQDLIQAKKDLYDQYLMPKSAQKNIVDLENNIELLEKKMSRASTRFRKEQETKSVDHVQIANELVQGEIAIEFTHFVNNADSMIYAANLLMANGDIAFVPLANEETLINKLNLKDTDSSNFINDIHKKTTRGIVKINKDLPDLYDLIWQPIEPYLNGVNKIYYSPSGMLNRINLNAIEVQDGSVLADKYEMVGLMSTRTIAIEKEKNQDNTVYLIGGIDYEAGYDLEMNDLTMITTSTNNGGQDELAFRGTSQSLRKGSWEYLKWTKTETESINKLFEEHNFEVDYKTGKEATEKNFKSLGTTGPSPRFLHLATHGYFFPDPQEDDTGNKNTFESSEHPLLRSGLILAGGNKIWQGQEVSPETEDGILTAYEISNMNLSNSELVVLSACETGLGDIQGSEGVYGLQRAFKMAGVRYLIMSIWQVPDEATSVFMTRFYKNYLREQMTIRAAFNKTQLEMRDQFSEPYNWAGFVLLE